MTEAAGGSLATRARSTISVAVICLDEERDLPACLASVAWCDDLVVVVDDRTTDRSAEIARRAGARVFLNRWEGQSPQKDFAMSICTGDWVLSIDADERVTPELRDEILEVLRRETNVVGFFVRRRNLWLGRWMRHGGWYPDLNLRLVRSGVGRWKYVVHERLEVDGSTAVLQSDLIHDNIQTISEHMWTAVFRATEGEVQEMVRNHVRFYWLPPVVPLWRYLREFHSGSRTRLRAYLLAKQHFKNRVAIAWLVPLSPAAKFVHMYVIKQGFRDGWHGFWVAVLSSIYVVLKYAKYWEQTRRRPSSSPISGDARED